MLPSALAFALAVVVLPTELPSALDVVDVLPVAVTSAAVEYTFAAERLEAAEEDRGTVY